MPAAWRAEPRYRDGVLLPTTKQTDGAASSLKLRNTSLHGCTVYGTGEMAVGAMMAWLPSMAPAGLSLGRTVFNLLSRGWTVNEIPSTPWASRSRQIKVLRSRSTRITAGRGT